MHRNVSSLNINLAMTNSDMTKAEAVQLFGNKNRLAIAVGISRQAISQWPDILPARLADRVIAAASRKGIAVPETKKRARAA